MFRIFTRSFLPKANFTRLRTPASSYKLVGNAEFLQSRGNHKLEAVRMSSGGKQVSWSVEPNPALIDDKIHIVLSGLQPHRDVTLSIKFTTENKMWHSHAHYMSDEEGQLDLYKAASTGGLYTGVEPCGLFWSAYIPGDHCARFLLRDLNTPHEYSISVREGHLDEAAVEQVTPLSQTKVWRQYKTPGVTRIPIHEGRIRGALFIPEGPLQQKFPGIIDLYGTAGGLLDTRAALLASRGFTTLALAYFAYEDLPKSFDPIEMEYFEDAVNWLGNHDKVISDKIGVIGISKGGELALLISTISEKIRAAVAINSFSYNSTIEHSFRGEKIPCITPNMEHVRMVDDLPVGDYCYENVPGKGKCAIPVEKSTAEFLLIHGSEDCIVLPSNAARLIQRFVDHEKSNYNLYLYEGTGHIFSPPYTPTCSAVYHRMFRMNVRYGGYNPFHAHAQEDSWRKILDFFRRTLLPNSKI